MDRSLSEDHIAFGPATPWQTDTFAGRTRRGESEPPLPPLKKGRSGRSNSVKAPRQAKRSVTQRSDGSRHRTTPPTEDGNRQHRAHGSLSAQTSPRPYETSTFTPAEVPMMTSPPPCTKAGSPTPPESFSEKSSSCTEKSVSPSSKQPINLLPGTMSARASSRQLSASRKKKPTKAKGWKVVFKEMFTKHPVDESQFERIEDRHWTDD